MASTCSSIVLPCTPCVQSSDSSRRMHSTYMCFAILNGWLHQLGIFGLFGSSKDERRVGCGILRLVFLDSCIQSVRKRAEPRPVHTIEVTRVADNGLWSLLA